MMILLAMIRDDRLSFEHLTKHNRLERAVSFSNSPRHPFRRIASYTFPRLRPLNTNRNTVAIMKSRRRSSSIRSRKNGFNSYRDMFHLLQSFFTNIYQYSLSACAGTISIRSQRTLQNTLPFQMQPAPFCKKSRLDKEIFCRSCSFYPYS